MNQKCVEYLDRILEVNQQINLTNITDRNKALLLHIEDSLAILPEIHNAPSGRYGDIGSGGGFPGVPIALESNRETWLIDSVQKKMKAVQNVLDDMNLSHIKTCGKRVEEVAAEHPSSCADIRARALSKIPSLMELAAPLLQKGGHLICLKAHLDKHELDDGKAIQKTTGMYLISRRNYFLSDKETYRECIVFEKQSDPRIKLPRRIGLAQKKPLCS